jgi:transaldolase
MVVTTNPTVSATAADAIKIIQKGIDEYDTYKTAMINMIRDYNAVLRTRLLIYTGYEFACVHSIKGMLSSVSLNALAGDKTKLIAYLTSVIAQINCYVIGGDIPDQEIVDE